MAQVDPSEVQRRALLQAVAEGGQAGRQAYERSQADVNAQQQQAVNAAAERATFINAEPGAAATGQQEAAAPFQRASTDLALGRASFEQDMARQQSAGESHLSAVSAAAPIHEAASRTAVQRILADSAQSSQDRQASLTDRLAGRHEADRERAFATGQRQMEARSERERREREDEVYRRAIEQDNIDRWNAAEDRNRALEDEMRRRQWEIEDRAWAEAMRKRGGGGGRSGGGGGGRSGGGSGNPLDDLVSGLGGITQTRATVGGYLDRAARANYEQGRPSGGGWWGNVQDALYPTFGEDRAIDAALADVSEQTGVPAGDISMLLGDSYIPDIAPDPRQNPAGEIMRDNLAADYSSYLQDPDPDGVRPFDAAASLLRNSPEYIQNPELGEAIIRNFERSVTPSVNAPRFG